MPRNSFSGTLTFGFCQKNGTNIMLNTASLQTFCQRKISDIQYFLLGVAVLTCLLTMGCKSSGNKSFLPFYGGGTQVKSPENEFPPAPPPVTPMQPIIINEGPGPATPSTPVSSPVTSNQSNGYSPPDMLPARNAAPVTSYARDNMTEVYDIPPGTKTNSGGSAGTLSGAYSGASYSGSSTGNSGTSYSSNSYDYGRSSATGSNSHSGRTYPASSTSTSSNETRYGNGTSYGGSSNSGSSNSGSNYDGSSYGGSSYGGSDYGGSSYDNSSPYDRYNHGPSTGHSSSLAPTGSGMEDGDYLADDGSMMRIINGKAYELVQYFDRPPILPGLHDGSQSQLSSQPQMSSQPQIPQTSTSVQIVTDYRTATQMTESFRQVPIPEYGSLLDQQANSLHVMSQGVITVVVPAKTTTIIPENTPVETVPSLNYSDYSRVGAITIPTSSNNGANNEADREMNNSIWAIMAKQNHDLLLFPQK